MDYSIIGTVKNQTLGLEYRAIAADSIMYLTGRFAFLTDDWIDTEKWVHFSNGNNRIDIPLNENDCITQDKNLNLTAGIWKVTISGHKTVNGEMQRITTTEATLRVEITSPASGETLLIPLSVGETILSRIGSLANLLTTNKNSLVAAINEIAAILSDKGDELTLSSDGRLRLTSGGQPVGDGVLMPVTSVNGQTGNVVINTQPTSGIKPIFEKISEIFNETGFRVPSGMNTKIEELDELIAGLNDAPPQSQYNITQDGTTLRILSVATVAQNGTTLTLL